MTPRFEIALRQSCISQWVLSTCQVSILIERTNIPSIEDDSKIDDPSGKCCFLPDRRNLVFVYLDTSTARAWLQRADVKRVGFVLRARKYLSLKSVPITCVSVLMTGGLCLRLRTLPILSHLHVLLLLHSSTVSGSVSNVFDREIGRIRGFGYGLRGCWSLSSASAFVVYVIHR